MKKNALISVVVPSYNEENNIYPLYESLKKELDTYTRWEILFVDDGSTDKTLQNIIQISAEDQRVKYVSFSRNFGHQNAIKAGLDFSSGDCVISMDADLQHPPVIIHQMIEKWEQGFEIVFTTRIYNKNQSFLKRKTSRLFYNIINVMSDIKLKDGVADFRLFDRKVVDVFKNEIHEYFLFVRGMVNWIGFKQTFIPYHAQERSSGNTKYTFRKQIGLALNGLTSLSVKPLRLSLILGFIFSFVSFIYAIYALYIYFFTDQAVSGWTSVIISVLFIGGVQMFLGGIQGEYLGKIFLETKRRPRYIVSETNTEQQK